MYRARFAKVVVALVDNIRNHLDRYIQHNNGRILQVPLPDFFLETLQHQFTTPLTKGRASSAFTILRPNSLRSFTCKPPSLLLTLSLHDNSSSHIASSTLDTSITDDIPEDIVEEEVDCCLSSEFDDYFLELDTLVKNNYPFESFLEDDLGDEFGEYTAYVKSIRIDTPPPESASGQDSETIRSISRSEDRCKVNPAYTFQPIKSEENFL